MVGGISEMDCEGGDDQCQLLQVAAMLLALSAHGGRLLSGLQLQEEIRLPWSSMRLALHKLAKAGIIEIEPSVSCSFQLSPRAQRMSLGTAAQAACGDSRTLACQYCENCVAGKECFTTDIDSALARITSSYLGGIHLGQNTTPAIFPQTNSTTPHSPGEGA